LVFCIGLRLRLSVPIGDDSEWNSEVPGGHPLRHEGISLSL
jgi:hypothetical protein